MTPMSRMRSTCLAALLVFLVVGMTRAEDPPTAEKIAGLVAQLGADRYDLRQAATEELRRIGRPALDALRKGSDSDDPEVRARSRALLRDIRLGITPDWPADLALMARHYDRLDEKKRDEVTWRIARDLGEKAVPFLVDRLGSDVVEDADEALSALQFIATRESWQAVIECLKAPETVQQNRALAWAYSRLDKPLEALKFVPAGEEDEPLREQIVDEAVDELLKLRADGKFRDLDSSAAAFAQADPNEPRFLYLRADALQAAWDDAQAEAMRAKARQLNPEDRESHFIAARMLIDLDCHRLAEEELQTVLRIAPESDVYAVNAWIMRGNLYVAGGFYAKGAELLEKGIDLYDKARKDGSSMGMVGASAPDLRKRIAMLREKAKTAPAPEDPRITDPLSPDGLRLDVSVGTKEGKKVYSVRVEPGLKLATLTDVTFRLNGTAYPWDEMRKGRAFDVLPKELHVVLTGTNPAGKPFTHDEKVPFDESPGR